MMSKKTWMKTLVAIEFLPLIAAWPLVASADVSTPSPGSAPSAMPSAAPSAVPSAAPSASPSAAPVVNKDPVDVDAATTTVFKGFRIEAEYTDSQDETSPIKGATLRGMMYRACEDKFAITNTIRDSELVARDEDKSLAIGFRITDLGGGVECQKKLKEQKVACTASTCVSLSSKEEAKIDLVNFDKKAKVGLIFDSGDDHGLQYKKIGSSEIVYKSPDGLRQEAEAIAQAKRAARIEANEAQFKNCRGNLDELALATKALNTLIRDTRMAIDEQNGRRSELRKVEAALLKKQKIAQQKALQKKIASVKSPAEAEELSAELAEFAEANPELATSVRQLQEDLVRHLRDNVDETPSNFAARKQVYQNLMGMEGVSAAEAKGYRVQMNGLDIAQQATLFQNGNFSNMNFYSFWSSYQKLYQTAQKDYSASCQNTKGNALSSACADSAKNLSAVQQLPQLATQAVQQQQQQQMLEQQQRMNVEMQMSRYMSQTMNTGVQNAAMPGQNGMPGMQGMPGAPMSGRF